MGYHRAGFDVVGVDLSRPALREYPFESYRADAIAVLRGEVPEVNPYAFDAIHASPPCQAYSRATILAEARGRKRSTVDLVDPVRDLLDDIGTPYVIENVPHAPLRNASIQLCGSAFGLAVQRHRLFEVHPALFILTPPCTHLEKPVGVYGRLGDQVKGTDSKTGKLVLGGRTPDTLEEAQAAMGIDWMSWDRLREAIPPAYTEALGIALLEVIAP
jgi:DNA (cytosine-5)-methyltransferase 1